MKIAKFTLKTLTPMFMGGADPLGEPELRTASIRGAMRFWFRAIAGAVTDDLQKVYELESKIFGNTENRSKVLVRVKVISNEIISKNSVIPLVRSINSRSIINNASKLNFLAYLANMGLAEYSKQKRAFVWARPGFDVNTLFKVEIIDLTDLGIAVDIFNVVVILGGFGARWRHGFGSCEIQSGPRVSWETAIQKVKKWILKQIEAVEGLPELNENKLQVFSTFRKRGYQIWERKLSIDSKCWSEILTYIGLKYREFRIKEGGYTAFGHTKDYLTLLKADGNLEKDILNDVFGLPIQFGKANIVEISDKKETSIGRRASPLILHVDPQKKTVRATLFKSRIIPERDSTQYYAQFGNKIGIIPPTSKDFQRINEFVQSLFENPRRNPNVQ